MKLPAPTLFAFLASTFVSTAVFAQEMPKKSTWPVLRPNEVMACKVKCLSDRSQDTVVFPGLTSPQDYCGLRNFALFIAPYSSKEPDGTPYTTYSIHYSANGGSRSVTLPISLDDTTRKPKYGVLIQTVSVLVAFECRVQTLPTFHWDIDKIYGQADTGKVSDAPVKGVAPQAGGKAVGGTKGSGKSVH